MALPKLSTPIFELTLPSTGQRIKYRPFLVKEHKTLLAMYNADDKEISRIAKELINVCTFNSLNVSSLPHFDIEYIFMNLRAKSIGENVEVIVNCTCGNKIETKFNIENLKVEKKPEHTNKIMITDTLGVELRYPDFEDVLAIYNSNDTLKVVDLIIKCIKSIFNNEGVWEAKDQPQEELQEFVYSLTKEQFEKIEEFFVTAPKIVQEVEADCDKCGKHNSTRIEGLSNFFV